MKRKQQFSVCSLLLVLSAKVGYTVVLVKYLTVIDSS